jgi:hypothetical protein
MSHDPSEEASGVTTALESPPRPRAERRPGSEREDLAELAAVLVRIEHALNEVREHLEASEHERQHREFSIARLLGSLLQALVIGLMIAALADWVYGQPEARQLVKLAFAGVLQLGALTAFLTARDRR